MALLGLLHDIFRAKALASLSEVDRVSRVEGGHVHLTSTLAGTGRPSRAMHDSASKEPDAIKLKGRDAWEDDLDT